MKQVEEAGGDLVVVVNMVSDDDKEGGRNRSNLTVVNGWNFDDNGFWCRNGKLAMVMTGQIPGDDVGQLNIYVVESEIQSKINSHISMDGILMTRRWYMVRMEQWRRKRWGDEIQDWLSFENGWNFDDNGNNKRFLWWLEIVRRCHLFMYPLKTPLIIYVYTWAFSKLPALASLSPIIFFFFVNLTTQLTKIY